MAAYSLPSSHCPYAIFEHHIHTPCNPLLYHCPASLLASLGLALLPPLFIFLSFFISLLVILIPTPLSLSLLPLLWTKIEFLLLVLLAWLLCLYVLLCLFVLKCLLGGSANGLVTPAHCSFFLWSHFSCCRCMSCVVVPLDSSPGVTKVGLDFQQVRVMDKMKNKARAEHGKRRVVVGLFEGDRYRFWLVVLFHPFSSLFFSFIFVVHCSRFPFFSFAFLECPWHLWDEMKQNDVCPWQLE